ncbi:hypothetical protein [Paracoccus mutanolyticus]|uniref:hypothetical protein n=1 Tax=Paracoccus mutanolyticus TaxID=1499308 RepID=UPI001676CE0D|nr:hypothetical protein [Paracoccus mutanolyticus]
MLDLVLIAALPDGLFARMGLAIWFFWPADWRALIGPPASCCDVRTVRRLDLEADR